MRGTRLRCDLCAPGNCAVRREDESPGPGSRGAVRQPRGAFIWKFEKPGFGTVLRTTSALIPRTVPPGDAVEESVALDEVAKIPAGVKIIAIHIKVRYRDQVIRELESLGLPNLEIGQCEKDYEF